MIIALEGFPGGGKSTLVEGFKKKYEKNGKSVFLYKTFLRRDIIEIIEKNIGKDGYEKLDIIIQPLKKIINIKRLKKIESEHDIVIVDRFLESIGGIIYGYFYPNIEMNKIYDFMRKKIYTGLDYHSVVLDISMEIGMNRSANRRGESYDEKMELLFYRMMDYLKYVDRKNESNIYYINALDNIGNVLKKFIKIKNIIILQ